MIASPDTKVFASFSATPGRFGATVYGRLFEALGIDAVYLPRPAPPRPDDVVHAMHAMGLSGASVSSPHKRTILPFLDEVDETARAAGAVNTIVRREGPGGDAATLHGWCTDVDGVRGCLAGCAIERSIVFGAGGVTGPTVAALRSLGARSITIIARRPEMARAVADRLGVDAAASPDDAPRGADLLVNATPAGRDDALPESVNRLLQRLDDGATVLDMPVSATDTTVVAAARARGLTVRTGVEMCTHQVVRQASIQLEAADSARSISPDDLASRVRRIVIEEFPGSR